MTKGNGSRASQDRKIAGEALQNALVGLIDLSIQGKQLHWNVTGPHFRSLHLQLDEIVDIAREHADTVAERAVAIGVYPDGRVETVARGITNTKRPAGPIADSDVVNDLVDLLETVSTRLREGIAETADADPISQDVLIAAAHDVEKQRWMVEAQRQ